MYTALFNHSVSIFTQRSKSPQITEKENHNDIKGFYIWALIFRIRENFPENTFILGIDQPGRGSCAYIDFGHFPPKLRDGGSGDLGNAQKKGCFFLGSLPGRSVFHNWIGDISCIVLPHFLEPFHNNREKCPFHLSILQQPMSQGNKFTDYKANIFESIYGLKRHQIF